MGPNAGKHASFDGDADRLVYYAEVEAHDGPKFLLLDGDRIATLYAKFVGEQLSALGLLNRFSVGLVQTNYANGAGIDYGVRMLNSKNGPTLAKTGVKHCHHKAKHLDIGIYFEANGHGTVIFSSRLVDTLKKMSHGAKKSSPSDLLLAFRNMINEAVGDAVADMLAVEACLKYFKWSHVEWAAEYNELPNRLTKVQVPDRFVMETDNENEAICVKPEGLQSEIDACVAKKTKGRSFVRPSGTEDVIRVYAEAETESVVDELLIEVSDLVRKYCGA